MLRSRLRQVNDLAIVVLLGGAVPAQAQLLAGNLLYTSIQPCRVVDTRLAGGPLAAGSSRSFNFVGSTLNAPPQGATTSDCAVPGFVRGRPQVQAVMVNLVAVAAAGPGDLRAYPTDALSVPNASVLNYAGQGALAGLNIANGIALPVRQDVQGGDITVQADVSGTQLVADVVGFFSKAQPRMYYLTTTRVDGAHALTACATGYHMASLWEIFNTATLLYDTTLGTVEDDSGAGPPASTVHSGWIRTGLRATNMNGIPGEDNCRAYTSTTGNGTDVALEPVWNGSPLPVSPWFPSTDPCAGTLPVWCVQD